ncbi:acyltransferase family protein [Microbacterium enclense]|uniref:Peptidoglycan/LPS O-acetylase OafA/YrhL, contains acyltransferase and SGNH-hydrolase domains n=1 Tax=Microbacterium enclense TaxID=993073 RepID=A0A1G6K7A9_9MICO|nr:acyltransferase [Microbacterium enclense]KSU54056.1 acyltransferase [Microbacterium enclense]SDC26837.1 Peptidoglycan/LPS O-acetylase OafA/YrhL, contains acyltransferase and SGNH-hydrolase domains [Microbacterium enclense]
MNGVRSLGDAFDPRNNSIGFLRWLMAFMVIFSHAGPVAGIFGAVDVGAQWGAETSLGGVAVTGFFFLSGMLITRSMVRSRSPFRYLWHRVVRIFPAWFLILVVTAFLLAPLAWIHAEGTIRGYLSYPFDSPWDYVWNNFTLVLNQWAIAGTGAQTHAVQVGYNSWNGSAWTLMYEFACYLGVLALGVVGALSGRVVGAAVAAAVLMLSTFQALHIGDLAGAIQTLSNPQVLQLAAPFAFGTIVQLFIEKVPLDDRLGIAMLVVAGLCWWRGGWFLFGQYAFAYGLIWFGTRVKGLAGWDRHADLSYGIYIAGWPVMFLLAEYGLPAYSGGLWYLVCVIVLVHLYAYLSYMMIEKPALDLKNWMPRWLARVRGVDAVAPGGGGPGLLRRTRFVPLSLLLLITLGLVLVGAARNWA